MKREHLPLSRYNPKTPYLGLVSLPSIAVVPGRDGDYCRVQVLGSLAACTHCARSAQGPQLYDDVQIHYDTPKKPKNMPANSNLVQALVGSIDCTNLYVVG